MAETKTTNPRARRTSASKTAAKPAAVTKTTAAKAKPVEAEKVTRFTVELEHTGDTKSYAKFSVPENLKGTMVGNVYAPLGTHTVKVLIIAADDVEASETSE